MHTTLSLDHVRSLHALRAGLLAACGGGEEAPTIAIEPADHAVVAPATATVNVVAEGDPTPTLHWQVSTDAGATRADIRRATAASDTMPTTGGADSTVAQLTVNEPARAQATVLSFDFEVSLPASIDTGSASLVGVQGRAGDGPAGNTFGGQMLRSATANTVTITLNDLPARSWLSLEFLFAAIDSLDGTGTFAAGDVLEVKVDGLTAYNESFANSLVTQIQSYVPPAGGELARRVEPGLWAACPESAHNMAIESSFQRIAHSGGSVTITFRMEGSGESIDNESWGIDKLRVVVGH